MITISVLNSTPRVVHQGLGRFPRGALLLLLLQVIGVAAWGQEKAIEIEQSGMQPPIQVGRPIPTWWDVKIRGSALVEGRIEFQLKNNSKLLATVMTEDLALTGPQQRIKVMLPPINDDVTIDQLQLQIKFHGKRFDQDLGAHILRIAISKSRSFMVLMAASRLTPKRSAERDRINRRLAFESLATGLDESVKTIVTPLDPADMPQEPLGYCAYELVVLTGPEFRSLKKPQLEALAAWVRAGGSLYLEPTGVLETYHVEFLRNLTASGPSELVIQPDSKGRLLPGTIWNDERLLLLRNGLGRIVLRVDDEDPEATFDTPAWREATAFLWRLHARQIQIVKENPVLRMNDLLGPQFIQTPMGQLSPHSNRLSMPLLTSTTELLDWLMPDGVRMVPLWVLAFILSSFVILIGPVDYIVLGKLRARKFTWITFPLATLLVTGLTVFVTNRYMSSSEARRGLVLQDIGDDGSIVRTSRFELLFIASTRTIATEVHKGLFTALGKGQPISEDPRLPQPMSTRMIRRGRGIGGTNDPHPPRMSGRIPTEYSVTQELAKWTPQLNRVFWIPGTSQEQKINWQALADGVTESMLQNHNLTAEFDALVKQEFGPKALAACLAGPSRWAIDQQQTAWRAKNAGQFVHTADPAFGNPYQQQVVPSEMQSQPELFRWLYQNSVAASFGLFTVTSQVGPTGGSDLNDLPIMDDTDPDQRLLIVVVPREDDFVVYRKLIRTQH